MIKVLVVEDEPLLAAAHSAYVQRVPGFVVVGEAHTGQEAMALLKRVDVDVILLDFHLPDVHGLDLCRALRAAGHGADVLAVTSARDLEVVRSAISLGVTQYLLKPFTFAVFKDKLERYVAYRRQRGEVAAQHQVDRMLAALRGPTSDTLPKGLGAETLDAIVEALRARPGQSAAEIAVRTGTSRVTARRYLEHLVETGRATRATRHGGAGRPEVQYRIVPSGQ